MKWKIKNILNLREKYVGIILGNIEVKSDNTRVIEILSVKSFLKTISMYTLHLSMDII